MAGATPRIANRRGSCQVLQRKSSHDELLRLGGHYRADCRNCYTYTLLRERELAQVVGRQREAHSVLFIAYSTVSFNV